MTHDAETRKVLDLIDEFPIAMLTTINADGGLESRPMARQKTEFDGEFYFVTQRHTDVSAQIEANPQVNLAFTKMGSWVSVQGTATIVNDIEKLKQLWNNATDAWTAGGPENPDNVLLVVEPKAAQYWDSPGAPMMVAGIIKAKLTGNKPNSGESATTTF